MLELPNRRYDLLGSRKRITANAANASGRAGRDRPYEVPPVRGQTSVLPWELKYRAASVSFDTAQPAHEALRSIIAERTSPVLAWVGAGLSKPAGVPMWGELRDSLAADLRAKADTMHDLPRKRLRAVADKAAREGNLWLAFELLKEGLGKTTFAMQIRTALQAGQSGPAPDAYSALWDLPVRGVLNLNLDGLATKALVQHDPDGATVYRSGPELAKLRHVLTGRARWVGNLHGSLDDVSTWVFTQSQVQALLSDEVYTEFLRVCLSAYTVMFIGITADDLAVGGVLESLGRGGVVHTPPHFWLTDRVDAKTDFWAERAGVAVVRYSSNGGDHAAVLAFLRDLKAATPVEPPAAPPVHLERAVEPAALPSAKEMRGWEPERIRQVLNAHATAILEPETEHAYERYQTFLRDYRFAIYEAWYLSPEPEENEVLGYKLRRHVARGAFGRVYEAVAPDGDTVAIKVLLEDVRQDPLAFHSFRRGVQSMRILSARSVEGMVRYREASEIPAFVVMDFVDGPNLATARDAGHIDDWHIIIRIACDLSAVVKRAHALPERVLHRDLRPENVMLKGFYGDDDWQLVVLDFDLSWHRDANERSVLHTTSAGYLAPEQMHRTPGVSTRSALVDSFGLGMTLLFLCTGEDPDPDEHRQVGWIEKVNAAARAVAPSGWACVPTRFARLILKATNDAQAGRWDLATIANELERLRTAVDQPNRVRSTELLTEEVAAQTAAFHEYRWDADALRASKAQPTGLEYTLAADLQNDRIMLAISWAATGVEDRRGVRKYLAGGAKKTEDQLRAAGWKKVRAEAAELSVAVEAQFEVADLRTNDIQRRVESVGSRLDRAIDNLRF